MTTRSVPELPASQRSALEHLLGQSLSTDQAVFVMAFTPGAADEATRAVARQRLEKTFDAAGQRAVGAGTAGDEADAVVEDAMRRIRPRKA